jgi:hypothetical protein
MILLILWIIIALIIPYFLAADDREIGFGLAFLACLLLSPVIGLIIILLSKEKKPEVKTFYRPTPQPISQADELTKFKKLLDEGTITQEEFDTQKRKILNQ